ncbi:hypothetical protein SNUCP2_27470 [Clostridium perfringens A]
MFIVIKTSINTYLLELNFIINKKNYDLIINKKDRVYKEFTKEAFKSNGVYFIK